MSQKLAALTPAQIAAATVQEWFDGLIGDMYAVRYNQCSSGSTLGDMDFKAVEAAVLQSLLKNDPDADEEAREYHAEEAGKHAAYLIGVQVGLRLRGVR